MLNDTLHLCEQSLVLSSCWGTMSEKCVGRCMLTLSTGLEVCACCWEGAVIDRERDAAFNCPIIHGDRL